MKKLNFRKAVIVAALVTVTSGCSSTITDSIVNVPQQNLVEYIPAVQDKNIQQSPIMAQNARWGGVVVSVNSENGKTILDIASYGLKENGRPSLDTESSGLFKVDVTDISDQHRFERGRLITAVGVVGEAELGKVGEFGYVYQKLDNADVHLWQGVAQQWVASTKGRYKWKPNMIATSTSKSPTSAFAMIHR